MTRDEFKSAYNALDAERDAIQKRINAIKAEYLSSHDFQPGDLVRIHYRTYSEPAAVAALTLRNKSGEISEILCALTAKGTPKRRFNRIFLHRSDRLQLVERGVYPEFAPPPDFWQGGPVSDDDPPLVYGDGKYVNIRGITL